MGIGNSAQAYGLDGCNMKSELYDGILEVPKEIVLFYSNGGVPDKFPCIVGVFFKEISFTLQCIAVGYSEDKSKIRCDFSRKKTHSFLQKNDDPSYYPFGCPLYLDVQHYRIYAGEKNTNSNSFIGLCIGSKMASLDGENAVEISFLLYNPYF